MITNEKIRFYILSNAVKYQGKANLGAILGKVLQEDPDLKKDIKELSFKISSLIKEINSLPLEEQKKELNKFDFEIEKPKKKEDKLPELEEAKIGNVVMRFAPNPNGPLSLGRTRPA